MTGHVCMEGCMACTDDCNLALPAAAPPVEEDEDDEEAGGRGCFMDSNPKVIARLPAHLRALLPVVQTSKSGMRANLGQLLVSLATQNVSHAAIISSFNQLQHVSAAQSELANLTQYHASRSQATLHGGSIKVSIRHAVCIATRGHLQYQ